MRSAVLFLLPAICLTLGAASRTEQRSLPLPSGGAIQVVTHNSPIRVEGWDKDEVAVTADIEDSAARPVRWEMRALDGGVRVEAIFPETHEWHMGRGPSCAFRLKVPRKVIGAFTTSNDTITANGFGGTLSFRTSNDKLDLSNLDGAVTATTTNASIVARHLHASLKGSTSNDELRLEDVEGGVDLSTSNADVVAKGLDGWGQGISLRTSNGDMTVDLGRATGEVHAITSRHESVKVEHRQVDLLESGGSELRFRIPGSAQPQAIELATTNGSLTIR
ncbi:MAG: hypothetical protein JST05_10035 [Acidobacteria bacterium]|nr:hypothetical protein [Acidobacteriota bacterium]